jgi:flagellar biosynthetic protein FlhB
MAGSDEEEKTEQATEARREEFRNRGQVAHSREFASAVFFLTAASSLYVVSRFSFQHISDLFQNVFGLEMVKAIREGSHFDIAKLAAFKAGVVIAPIVALLALLGALSSVLQIGFLSVEDALGPDFEKINPINGFNRIISFRSVVEGLKSFLKISLVVLIVYLILKSEVRNIPYLVGFSLPQLVQYVGSLTVKLFFVVGLVMAGLAGLDFLYQKWDLEKQMMMTKQEIKEELKQREGDPMIKARIRKIQRDMANRRMMDQIPKADVVVTNPTHIAVVLRYSDQLPAPQLVAKGADFLAEKIKQLAREHNIPIVENKPLARTIYKTMKLNQVIPRELFVAVAEVLSYVYKLKRKARR